MQLPTEFNRNFSKYNKEPIQWEKTFKVDYLNMFPLNVILASLGQIAVVLTCSGSTEQHNDRTAATQQVSAAENIIWGSVILLEFSLYRTYLCKTLTNVDGSLYFIVSMLLRYSAT